MQLSVNDNHNETPSDGLTGGLALLSASQQSRCVFAADWLTADLITGCPQSLYDYVLWEHTA